MGVHAQNIETRAKEIGAQTKALDSTREPLHFLQTMEITKSNKLHTKATQITQKPRMSLHGKTIGTHQKPLE